MRFGVLFATGLVALSLIVSSSQLIAADLDGTVPPEPDIVAPSASELETYVKRRAVLYQIRSIFDVVLPDEIQYLLLADALNVNGAAFAAAETELNRDLLSEGNYFLVSLKYLIEGGGAAWPAGRPTGSYAADAQIRIAAMQDQLSAILAQNGDPLPVMLQANEILAQTEGVAELSDDINYFAGRDEAVAEVLKQIENRT